MNKATVSAALLLMSVSGLASATTSTAPVGKAPKLTSIGILAGVPHTPVSTYGNYKAFSTSTFYFWYDGKKAVRLTGDEAGTQDTAVTDLLEIEVTHPNGTVAYFNNDYSQDCSKPNSNLAPADLTYAFAPGLNKVVVTLSEVCGQGAYSSALWLGSF